MTFPFYSHPDGFFNREFFQTRTLNGDEAGTPVFTAVEEKLIRLGLDPAAHPGEVSGCATKLFESLRRRGISPEEVITRPFEKTIWAVRRVEAARGYCVSSGKYRGRSVGELPPSYLDWALKNRRDLPLNERLAMQIVLETSEKRSTNPQKRRRNE